ncbi:MAG: DUF1707 domain-containing protein [Propionibacteriales bacterium]|nr:DUF1707 domain-containing protein [Propionibacteriales bacterium]
MSTTEMRASDEERDRVVAALSEHMTSGRLTLAELEDRVGLAFEATTRGELDKLTADLPDVHPAAPAARKPTRWIVGLMGGSNKHGRRRVAERVYAVAVMGGHDIDLRAAELESEDTTIVVVAVMGGTDVYVPDGIDVEVGGFSIMGGTSERGSRRGPRPGAPRIRILAYNLMGGIDVWRLPREAKDLPLKQARRVAKNAT